eukprot:TRINITY_DN2458_c0_g1_i4.p1 TRINITY_DN2458_c0_g1~~TRINITY_DN2458_c0_g1_i4.p1  ORF type:complete len:662 (-),score=105.92 TRINITY_DN2458_c0_g1_i4:46-2031(-)
MSSTEDTVLTESASDQESSSEGSYSSGAEAIAAEEPQKAKSQKKGINIDFRDVSYSVEPHRNPIEIIKRKPRKVIEILDNVSGYFAAGKLTAIMGPSGAGKTSFLNIIADRAGGKISGNILANGRPISNVKKHVAFVAQDDVMLGNLSVHEQIMFSAKLRLPPSVSREERKQKVIDIETDLNLTSCANTFVGIPGVTKGVSGGERKRTAVGIELITNPQLIFLDEPTSGLDSTTAFNLITNLRDLCRKQNKTIICTIHQPSSEIFYLFDDLFLLAKGMVVYSGPVSGSVKFFKRKGFPTPKYTNPADHFLNVISENGRIVGAKPFEERLKKFAKGSLIMEQKRREEMGEPQPESRTEDNSNKVVQFAMSKTVFFIRELGILLHRTALNTFRNKQTVIQALMQELIMAVMLGLIFLQLPTDNESGINDRLGLIFIALMGKTFMNGQVVLTTFPLEKGLVLREFYSNMYSAFSYFLSKMLVDLPTLVVFPALFATIIYWMGGLQADFGRFVVFVVFLLMQAQLGYCLGFLLSVLLPLRGALALQPVIIIPFSLLSGFFISVKNTPVYFLWMLYISPFFWNFQALAVNELTDLEFDCDSSKTSGSTSSEACVVTGEEKIDDLEFVIETRSDLWVPFLILAAEILLLRTAGYIILYIKGKRAKPV